MIKVTDCNVYPISSDSKVKAFAKITINESLVLTGLKIIEGQNGPFVGFPSQKGKDDDYRDLFFPITKEARECIVNAILSKYQGQAQQATPSGGGGSAEGYSDVPNEPPLPF